MKFPNLKSTNFFNDVVRVVKWFINGVRKRDNSRIGSFFHKIFREMKRE